MHIEIWDLLACMHDLGFELRRGRFLRVDNGLIVGGMISPHTVCGRACFSLLCIVDVRCFVQDDRCLIPYRLWIPRTDRPDFAVESI